MHACTAMAAATSVCRLFQKLSICRNISRPLSKTIGKTFLQQPTVIAANKQSVLCTCVTQHQIQATRYTQSHHPGDRNQLFSTSVSPLRNDETLGTEVVEHVNATMASSRQLGRLFAIVHIAASQRKITDEDIIVIHGNFQANCGDKIRIEKVLMVGSKDFTLVGRPLLSKDVVRVDATVIEKRLDQGKVVARFKKRKRYKRMFLHRQPLTYLRINSIKLNQLEETT